MVSGAKAPETIYADIPYFVPRIQENHLRLMNAIMGFLAMSPITTINVESMSKQWSLGKGSKIFFADPSMYGSLSGSTGNVREAFVALWSLGMMY